MPPKAPVDSGPHKPGDRVMVPFTDAEQGAGKELQWYSAKVGVEHAAASHPAGWPAGCSGCARARRS